MTQCFPAGRLTSYEILVLSPPHLYLKHCNALSPATLLLLSQQGKHYDNEVILSHFVTLS